MSASNNSRQQVVKIEKVMGEEPYNVDFDSDSITVPLSYGQRFSLATQKGETIPISAVSVYGNKIVINHPGNGPTCCLQVQEAHDFSGTDPNGVPINAGDGEEEDNFLNWLSGKIKDRSAAQDTGKTPKSKLTQVFVQPGSWDTEIIIRKNNP